MEAMTHATASTDMPGQATSEKDFVPAILLCFFVGMLGAHRFYVGKIGTGILQILTFGGLGIWVMVDFIMIATGNFKDSQGLPVKSS
jgi:TM2 domain-containing membrane protein YozV